MPALAPALDADDKRVRLAALRDTLARKGLLVEVPAPGTPAGPAPLSTGWAEVDALLDGGFPRRAIAEVLGPAACGKTSLVAAALAGLTRAGSLVAWIDAAAELYPPALAAAGVDLSRLLIVRPCGGEQTGTGRGRGAGGGTGRGCDAEDAAAALWAAEVLLQSGSFDAVVLDATALPAPPRRALDRRVPVLRGAAESYDTALIVLAEAPFGLPPAVRLRTEPRPGKRCAVSLEKSRTGRPGGSTLVTPPSPAEPPLPAPPPLLARAAKPRTSRPRR